MVNIIFVVENYEIPHIKPQSVVSFNNTKMIHTLEICCKILINTYNFIRKIKKINNEIKNYELNKFIN